MLPLFFCIESSLSSNDWPNAKKGSEEDAKKNTKGSQTAFTRRASKSMGVEVA